jgi:hypothetical protein
MTRIANARAFANRLLKSALPLLMVAVAGAPVPAQRLNSSGTLPVQPEEVAAPKRAPEAAKQVLSQFSWLDGYWRGQWGPRVAQQAWMPAQSGTMVGVFQLSENTKTLVVELYSIVATPQGIELRIRRFTPALVAWEKSALLNLQSVDSQSMLFENASDGQPKSWLMTRSGPDTLIQKFEIVPEKGQQHVAQIVYHRQRAPVTPKR